MPWFLCLIDYLLQRLQYVQNAEAMHITQERTYDHVTQIRRILTQIKDACILFYKF